jgi:hypothetical protein
MAPIKFLLYFHHDSLIRLFIHDTSLLDMQQEYHLKPIALTGHLSIIGFSLAICASLRIDSFHFLTTLTMVGLVTFPLERREFGLRFTTTRNIFSFAFAIMIALAMGVII